MFILDIYLILLLCLFFVEYIPLCNKTNIAPLVSMNLTVFMTLFMGIVFLITSILNTVMVLKLSARLQTMSNNNPCESKSCIEGYKPYFKVPTLCSHSSNAYE